MLQNTQETFPKTSILSEKLFLGLKWAIFLGIIWMLYHTIKQKNQSFENILLVTKNAFIPKNTLKIAVLLVFIFVNWAFEAKKWQVLAQRIEPLSFTNAFQSVLIGLSLGFITPANLGDYAGRIWTLKHKNKTEAIGAILMGNGIQFYVSMIFGVIAYLIIGRKEITIFDQIIFCLLIFTLFLGIFIYAKRLKLIGYLPKKSWLIPYQKYFKVLVEFDAKEILQVFNWSILRYLTFSLQFVILLVMFEVNINLIDLWAISCLVFLFKTIIPTINFISDLVVREYTALHFFGLFSVDTSSVMVATFCLWLINILFPVVVGAFILLFTPKLNNLKE